MLQPTPQFLHSICVFFHHGHEGAFPNSRTTQLGHLLISALRMPGVRWGGRSFRRGFSNTQLESRMGTRLSAQQLQHLELSASFKQGRVPVLELDHSQLDIHANRASPTEHIKRFKDLLVKLTSTITTPSVAVVKIEPDTAGHLLEAGAHTNLAATPEEQAAALAKGLRVMNGMQLFKAWGSGQFEGLGALAGAVEIVFILSGSLENDSSHPCNYDAVKDAIRIQQAKLSTWPQDPVRLFPDTTLSPAISEMLTATLQQLPRNEPVVIPANNDYDSLRKYSLQVVAPEC